jgi:hypothetical protein
LLPSRRGRSRAGPGRTLNAGIAPERLSAQRRLAARTSHNVVLQPEPAASLVQAVFGSVYERSACAGRHRVHAGYQTSRGGERNMAALTSAHELAFQVVRAARCLSVRLNETASDGQG